MDAPYSPQQNPTERANRTVKTMISQYLDGEQSSWDTLLPEISLAINSSKSVSNGFSPASLVQGREPRLPGILYHEVTPSLGTEAPQPDDKARHLQEIFKVAKENMQRATAEQSRHYNLRRREWKPALGDLVLLRQHHLSKAVEGFAAKLAPRYDVPYKHAIGERAQRPAEKRTLGTGREYRLPHHVAPGRHALRGFPEVGVDHWPYRPPPHAAPRIPRRRSREAAEPVARRRRRRSPTQPGKTQRSEPGTQAEQVTAPGRLRVPRPESSVQAEQVADSRRARPQRPEPSAQAEQVAAPQRPRIPRPKSSVQAEQVADV
ncbi:hypothetical protein ACLKA7_017677 [Drosophila subpalustris]